MGATITWRPAGSGSALNCGHRSNFIRAMGDVFGGNEWTLGLRDVPTLRGMASVAEDSEPYRELVRIIEQVGGDVIVSYTY